MAGRLDALRERPFRLLFFGQTASLLGDGMVPVALAFAVLDLTGSATDLGIVLAARTIPLVAFLLAGGVWADRLPGPRGPARGGGGRGGGVGGRPRHIGGGGGFPHGEAAPRQRARRGAL